MAEMNEADKKGLHHFIDMLPVRGNPSPLSVFTACWQAALAHARGEQDGRVISADDAWQDLIEKDGRTSPADQPDMALITRSELGSGPINLRM